MKKQKTFLEKYRPKTKRKKTDYEILEDVFEKVEKIFHKEFGHRCPDFEPLCVQCSFWQDFNNFKRETFKRSFG